jgi:hypothetical protein
MTLVYCERRANPCAEAKMASMALALAQARVFVALDVTMPLGGSSDEHRAYCGQLLARIDEALEGTIHSFKRRG